MIDYWWSAGIQRHHGCKPWACLSGFLFWCVKVGRSSLTVSWPHSVGLSLNQNEKGEGSRVFAFIILCFLQIQCDQLPPSFCYHDCLPRMDYTLELWTRMNPLCLKLLWSGILSQNKEVTNRLPHQPKKTFRSEEVDGFIQGRQLVCDSLLITIQLSLFCSRKIFTI